MTLHLTCPECHFLDIVLYENGKDWECPNCRLQKKIQIKCDKCKKEYPKDELSELFGWGLYICTECIYEFIPEERPMTKEENNT